MPARGLASLVLLAAPLVAAAPTDDLTESCRRLQEGSNPYFGTRFADELRAELSSNPASPAIAAELGSELLRLGDTAEAIEHLAAAVRTLAPPAAERPTIPEWNLALAHLQRAEDLNCVHHLDTGTGPDDGTTDQAQVHGPGARPTVAFSRSLPPPSTPVPNTPAWPVTCS